MEIWKQVSKKILSYIYWLGAFVSLSIPTMIIFLWFLSLPNQIDVIFTAFDLHISIAKIVEIK